MQPGATTFVDVELSVDVLEQVVEALDLLPELLDDWHGVDGVVSRFQIESPVRPMALASPGLEAMGS